MLKMFIKTLTKRLTLTLLTLNVIFYVVASRHITDYGEAKGNGNTERYTTIDNHVIEPIGSETNDFNPDSDFENQIGGIDDDAHLNRDHLSGNLDRILHLEHGDIHSYKNYDGLSRAEAARRNWMGGEEGVNSNDEDVIEVENFDGENTNLVKHLEFQNGDDAPKAGRVAETIDAGLTSDLNGID
eukprot:TCONS_00017196-protein